MILWTARKETLSSTLTLSEKHFSTYNFLHILSEYVKDGLYGFLFTPGTDQTFKLEDKKLIVFELDEVKDNKEMLSVMLKLIKSAIQRTIWNNRTDKELYFSTNLLSSLNSREFWKVLSSITKLFANKMVP